MTSIPTSPIRQSVVELIVLLLEERRRVYNSEDSDEIRKNICDRHIRQLISGVLLWKYSEAEGHKYTACRYWSEGACQSFTRYGKVITSRSRIGNDALRHEHLYPRKQLTNDLFSIDEPNAAEVQGLLEQLNIAVIVTCGEHQRLSPEGSSHDPWERYRKAGIMWTDKHAGSPI